jgi:hypothetical protein
MRALETTLKAPTKGFSMSIYGDFRERADECVRLAQKARTRNDQELFLDMATAWLGVADRDSGKAAIRIGLSVPKRKWHRLH